MSKFLSSSVNYSETELLKTQYLFKILELYNQQILSQSKHLISIEKQYIIPNNNQKYYLFIINKNEITQNQNNNKYKILYFFPHDKNTSNILTQNSISDFYIEIDNHITTFDKNNYLFEGYLYNNNTFLITDVLAIDSQLITENYSLRYALLYNLIGNQHLYNVNEHLTIELHSMFELDPELNDITQQKHQLFNVFKHNFIFKQDIIAIETIHENLLEKSNEILDTDIKIENKIIKKTKYVEVYDVYDITTNNHQGILYIKGLTESKQLKNLLINNDSINIKCSFNTHFKKWQPIIN